MKVYKKFIRPVLTYQDQNGAPNRLRPFQSEKTWYSEEEMPKLIREYERLKAYHFDLTFDEKFEEIEIPVLVQVTNELGIAFTTKEELIESDTGIIVNVTIKRTMFTKEEE